MMAWYNMNRETQGKEHRVYIANQENLAAFAERAMHSSVLAIDTEFLREKTYYCLLYTSDAADELDGVDLGGRRIIKKKFFQAEDGIRDQPRSRGLGDVYKRQPAPPPGRAATPQWSERRGSLPAVSYTHLTLPTN